VFLAVKGLWSLSASVAGACFAAFPSGVGAGRHLLSLKLVGCEEEVK
jgi:hypothetical protein